MVIAPSGAGKSSLVAALLRRRPEIHLSISYTTRAPRPGEIDGREYFFIDREQFLQRQAAGEFLESALVHGNQYGTSRIQIETQFAAGRDVLLEIDWQGAQQIRRAFPQAIGVFIVPPSLNTLAQRLTHRGQDAPEVIRRRVEGAGAELSHALDFDYLVVNQAFDRALDDLEAIVTAAHLTVSVQRDRQRALLIGLGLDLAPEDSPKAEPV
jgi:guanylate kinase